MRDPRKPPFLIASLFALLGNALPLLAQDSASWKIAPEERQALVALYHATNGPNWTNKSGWLGPPGTECDWYGVTCDPPERTAKRTPSVVSVELSENKLAGAVPPELGHLKNLEWLEIFGNHLTGRLPGSLLQRWLAGPLQVGAEAHLLTTVTKVDYEWSAHAVPCARQRIVLESNGNAVVYTERCRNATPDDRTTFCEVKEGQLLPAEFARLAWGMEKAGFFRLRSQYDRSMTHSVFENTRVTRNGKTVAVSNYASAGPFELWGIQRVIEGIAANVETIKTSQLPTCPRW
jgi:hypothetical protein